MSMGTALSEQLAEKISELKEVASAIDEVNAVRRPADGEWCAKEVLSHLAGDDSSTVVDRLNRFVIEDTPEIELTPGVSAFGPARENAPLPELISQVKSQYGALGTFLSGLADEQFGRKAHVPALKDTPFGEYPTLGQWAGFLINVHLGGHINQLRALKS
jgi:hypothetical protein